MAENLNGGMFARVAISAAERTPLMVPASAVEWIGQLEFAMVMTADGRVERRLVTTGETDQEGRVEVLSGPKEGELINLGSDQNADPERIVPPL